MNFKSFITGLLGLKKVSILDLNVIFETIEYPKKGQILYPELVGVRADHYLNMRTKKIYRPLDRD